jgi:hypothetical protein
MYKKIYAHYYKHFTTGCNQLFGRTQFVFKIIDWYLKYGEFVIFY